MGTNKKSFNLIKSGHAICAWKNQPQPPRGGPFDSCIRLGFFCSSHPMPLSLGKGEWGAEFLPTSCTFHWTKDIIDSMGKSLSKLWGIVKDREAWCAAIYGVTKSWHNLATEQQTTNSDLWLQSKNSNTWKPEPTKDKIAWYHLKTGNSNSVCEFSSTVQVCNLAQKKAFIRQRMLVSL